MRKKEIIAMLLAGGQGSRLGILTKSKAKPAVSFGGKYRIIDFPMSNCINSGVDTVGVLTQYQPLQLNRHIGIGTPWDLDRTSGGVTILAPHVKEGEEGFWYSGTANAIFQNINFIDTYDPTYVLIISGDHIYKMDYSDMLDFHKRTKSDATIAVLEVSLDEASRFGIMNADGNDKIYEFEEKPQFPKSNLASMGIYIFTWKQLKECLIEAHDRYNDADFGKHIIPMFLEYQKPAYAYRFKGYWKDVGTIDSYFAAHMDLIKTMPDFNLYEDFAKIYTSSDHQSPQFTGLNADIKGSLISEGCEVYGIVYNSILGPDVKVADGAVVRDSIIMAGCVIGENAEITRTIIDENSIIGRDVKIGVGENTPNIEKPHVYDTGITVIAENSIIPDGIYIGKNCVVCGATEPLHYTGMELRSGGTLEL
ncbi:MAG: glucose-1-phosphate adenylyltransferase [Defluviitaleaceae bacterium]|nr:glucose-1-phosphate adenylyltransferase [Defluviitaleaceae bacterium]